MNLPKHLRIGFIGVGLVAIGTLINLTIGTDTPTGSFNYNVCGEFIKYICKFKEIYLPQWLGIIQQILFFGGFLIVMFVVFGFRAHKSND